HIRAIFGVRRRYRRQSIDNRQRGHGMAASKYSPRKGVAGTPMVSRHGVGRRRLIIGVLAMSAASGPLIADTSDRVLSPPASGDLLRVLHQLQTIMLSYPADRSRPGPEFQHVSRSDRRLHALYDELPTRRRARVDRGAAWFRKNTSLVSAQRFVETLRARDLAGGSSALRADVLAATSVAICGLAPRLSGAGDSE